MMGKHTHKLGYSKKYDAYFCPLCNVWKERKCNDITCEFCEDRPDKPMMEKQEGENGKD